MKAFIKLSFCFTGFFLLITILHGCDNDPLQGGPYWGTASANKNGVHWNGKIRGSEQNGMIGITIDKHSSQGFLREDLFMDRIPKFVGTYSIPKTDTLRIHNHPTSNYFTLQDDGDVLQGVYYVDPNSTSFVELKSLQGDFFEGSFEVVFLVDPESKNRYPFLPDTVRFTNGKFRTRILQKL
jgi:hypothetical protein